MFDGPINWTYPANLASRHQSRGKLLLLKPRRLWRRWILACCSDCCFNDCWVVSTMTRVTTMYPLKTNVSTATDIELRVYNYQNFVFRIKRNNIYFSVLNFHRQCAFSLPSSKHWSSVCRPHQWFVFHPRLLWSFSCFTLRKHALFVTCEFWERMKNYYSISPGDNECHFSFVTIKSEASMRTEKECCVFSLVRHKKELRRSFESDCAVSSVQWIRTNSTASNSGRKGVGIDALELWRTVVGETGLMLAETDETALVYALLVVELIQLW